MVRIAPYGNQGFDPGGIAGFDILLSEVAAIGQECLWLVQAFGERPEPGHHRFDLFLSLAAWVTCEAMTNRDSLSTTACAL
jgi:hypothetical protein